MGACSPRTFLEIRCSEIASEAILGQKQSCSSSIRYMARRELYIMKHTNIAACERYTYRELAFTNTVNK